MGSIAQEVPYVDIHDTTIRLVDMWDGNIWKEEKVLKRCSLSNVGSLFHIPKFRERTSPYIGGGGLKEMLLVQYGTSFPSPPKYKERTSLYIGGGGLKEVVLVQCETSFPSPKFRGKSSPYIGERGLKEVLIV
ncbi:hypothetical protein VNO77_30493 [Canavalia gladiata]|uniref:Uncharacterized protein n=1 Tax=Canavalia gladiata TaxID=3824 RepID=A0AAN9KN27_CANGL